MRLILFLVIWLARSLEAKHVHNRTDIYFAAFFPMTPPHSSEGLIGHGVMPAVRLAIKHINQSPNVLKGYKLHMYWNDTQCNPGVGLKAFFDMVHLSPKKLILFGGACSPVTDQIAKAARHWNLVQLTYADTHPMFTEKSFPHFYRVVPSENEFNPPRLSILRYYNWTRVGTLYQNSAKYSLAHNNLVSELEDNNFTVVASQSFNDEITNQLDILMSKDSRIILGNFNESWARAVFCEAYKKSMYGFKFQWLIVGMYDDEWWLKEDESLDCTPRQIQTALIGVMVMDIQALASREEITVSGRMPVEYEKQYTNMTKHYSRYHGYAYDGVWAAALAIEEVERKARAFNMSLPDFDYRNKIWESLFISALDKTSFEGVTGPVRFKGNSRRGNIVIKQIVRTSSMDYSDGEQVEDEEDSEDYDDDEEPFNIREQCIGEYSGVTRTLYLERCGQVFWVGDRPPKDRTIIRIEPNRVNITIYSALCIIASLGIVLAISFLIVNIKYRKQKHIKMSSPNLNNLIIVGCILTYTSVIFLGLDSYMTSTQAFPYICTARAWILMSGFTLSFGSMFSKTWRVHSIFTNVQLNKKVMKDSQLYLVVGLLMCIDVVTMTAWQLMDPFYRDTKKLEPYTNELDGVQIIPKLEYCRSNHMTIFVSCIYVYKGLLMVFGAFLAWETRQVQIPALNDSKYVGMSLYNVAIMCVLGVAVSFVLRDHQNASFIIISIFIIFCTTGTLCLVFVPKIIDLKRDPHGTMDRRMKPTIKTGNVPKNPLQTMEDKLRIANKVNKKYKELMNELDDNINLAMQEIGNEEAKALLENSRSKNLLAVEKSAAAHVSFAIDVTDMSSSSSTAMAVVNRPPASTTTLATLEPPPSSSSQHHQPPAAAAAGSSIVVTTTDMTQRTSAASTITSDYFSMNSKEATAAANQRTLANGKPQKVFLHANNKDEPHHILLGELPPPAAAVAAVASLNNMASSPSSIQQQTPDFIIPPPPPQYDTSPTIDVEAGETSSDLCRKLSCSGHTCNSQEDSFNSVYTDEDDEEDEEEEYYQIRKTNQDCNSLAIESHSCQTYEDHATQTEDEDSENEQHSIRHDYHHHHSHSSHRQSRRRRSEDFSPCCSCEAGEAMLPPPSAAATSPPMEDEWEVNKANSLRFRSSHHHQHNGHKKSAVDVIDGHHASSISNQNINNVDSIEILPIFHKLLEDKRSSDCAFNKSVTTTTASSTKTSNFDKDKKFHSARSCPDMSVRCDIVEYL